MERWLLRADPGGSSTVLPEAAGSGFTDGKAPGVRNTHVHTYTKLHTHTYTSTHIHIRMYILYTHMHTPHTQRTINTHMHECTHMHMCMYTLHTHA